MGATTILVTRNVRDRFRGFLASCTCEVAPGVYLGFDMNSRVRERVWDVLESWWQLGDDASVVMAWPKADAPGGMRVKTLGVPPVELVEIDDLILTRRDADAEQRTVLTKRLGVRT
jgi:CRISPR-associated protein Cas2